MNVVFFILSLLYNSRLYNFILLKFVFNRLEKILFQYRFWINRFILILFFDFFIMNLSIRTFLRNYLSRYFDLTSMRIYIVRIIGEYGANINKYIYKKKIYHFLAFKIWYYMKVWTKNEFVSNEYWMLNERTGN